MEKIDYHCKDLFVGLTMSVKTEKNSKNFIYRKSLSDILFWQSNMPYPSDDEHGIRWHKEHSPAIYPVYIDEGSRPYNDDVFVKGDVVFIDLDSEDVAGMLWDYRYDIVREFPYIAAMSFSVSRKMHLFVASHWEKMSGYGAAWDAAFAGLRQVVGNLMGRKAANNLISSNDYSMINATQCFAVMFSKDYEEFPHGYFVPANNLADYLYLDQKTVIPDMYSLFNDDEVMGKYSKCRDIGEFVKWCERNRNYTYSTENKQVSYDKSVFVDGDEIRYWENDGTHYRILETCDSGWKFLDHRKRRISIAAKFFVCVMGKSFEESLYCTCKYYVRNAEPWKYREKNLVLERVERYFANKEKMSHTLSSFIDNRKVVVDPHRFYDEDYVYHDTHLNMLTKGEKISRSFAVKKAMVLALLNSLYEKGDNVRTLTEKINMCEGYEEVGEQSVRRLAKELGLDVKKKRIDSKDYVNVYDLDGKRTKVRAELVDGKNYFASKKDLKNHKSK